MESQRKAILRKLEDDLSKASTAAGEYDEIYRGTHKIIEQLKDGKKNSYDLHHTFVYRNKVEECLYLYWITLSAS